jgi:hypothetical protein
VDENEDLNGMLLANLIGNELEMLILDAVWWNNLLLKI